MLGQTEAYRLQLTSIWYSAEINSKNVEWYEASELYNFNLFLALPLPPPLAATPAVTEFIFCPEAARSSIFLSFHLELLMGDDDSIWVVVVAVDSEGGVKDDSVVSIWPRCILAVRLSDAFCFRIVMTDDGVPRCVV